MGKAKLSLEEFASTIRKVRRCWVCNIRERSEIDARRRRDDKLRAHTGNLHNGMSTSNMARWLVEECGYSAEEATPTKLKSHFDRRHHEEEDRGGKG